jgi:hypothetical protein
MNRHTQTARRQVFVNCPFDEAYRPLFQAIIFSLNDLVLIITNWLASLSAADRAH